MNTANTTLNPEDLLEHAEEATQLLKALANRNRLMVLCILAEGECSVGQLHSRVSLSQSALSQHLAVLRSDGLVVTRRESQSIFYALANDKVRRVVGLLHELYCPA